MSSEFGTVARIAPAVALIGCSVPLEEQRSIAIEDNNLEVSMSEPISIEMCDVVDTLSEDLNMVPEEFELFSLGFLESGIDSKIEFNVQVGENETRTISIYYSSIDNHNHIIPNAENLAEILAFIYDAFDESFDEIGKEDAYKQMSDVHLFFGTDWHIKEGISFTYTSARNGSVYNFVNETKGLDPIDDDIMELVHACLSSPDVGSYPLWREGFAATLSILVKSVRLGLPYKSDGLEPGLVSYEDMVDWAKTLNLSVPDSNDPEKKVPVNIIKLSEEFYQRAVEIWGDYPYERPDNSFSEEHQSQLIDFSTLWLKSHFPDEKYSSKIESWGEFIAQDYFNHFNKLSIQHFVQFATDWVGYSATV